GQYGRGAVPRVVRTLVRVMRFPGLRIIATHVAVLAHDVNQAVVNQRRRHIGRPPEPPALRWAAGLDCTGRMRIDRGRRPSLARRNDNQISGDGRRRYEAEGSVAGRVQVADAPDLLTVVESVSRRRVVAVDDEQLLLTVLPQRRGCVGVGTFGTRVAISFAID